MSVNDGRVARDAGLLGVLFCCYLAAPQLFAEAELRQVVFELLQVVVRQEDAA